MRTTQAFSKWTLWLGGALVWAAGASLVLFALAAPARAEMAFSPERARLDCAGAEAEALKGQGNAVHLPMPTAEQLPACRVEIDFSVRDAAVAERAVASGYVELVGLKRIRAAFPERLPVNRDSIALAKRPGGGLTLSVALETLLGGDRQRGAAVILAWRDSAEAHTYLSATLLIERIDRSLRAKRAGN